MFRQHYCINAENVKIYLSFHVSLRTWKYQKEAADLEWFSKLNDTQVLNDKTSA